MKLPLIALTALASLATTLPAAAQTTQKFTASKASDYGITYTLPRTVVDVTVEARFTVRTPGEFYNYARRYLNIDNAVTKPEVSVEVLSAVIDTHGEADDDNRWQMQFKAGATPYAILDGNGALLSLNTDEVADRAPAPLPLAKAAAPTALEGPAARQAMTEDMIKSSSLSMRARLAAQRIFELREMRSDLISGQADNTPPDGHSLQLALDNLGAQEAALTAMFAGTVSTYTAVATKAFVPQAADETYTTTLMRLSPVDGFVGADDLSGEPITLTVTINERATLPINDKGEEKRFPKGGVAYTIPGTATVTVSFRGREIASEQLQLAQAGVTFGLDPALFTDKKAPSRLQLDPATGAIVLLGPVE